MVQWKTVRIHKDYEKMQAKWKILTYLDCSTWKETEESKYKSLNARTAVK